MSEFHTHKDERGFIVRCYHKYKPLNMMGSFLLGITVSFPFEHYLWEKVFPFSWITNWLGL